MNKKESKSDSFSDGLSAAVDVVTQAYFTLSYQFLKKMIKDDNYILKRISRKRRFVLLVIAALILGSIYYVTPFLATYSKFFYLNYVLLYPVGSGFLIFFFAEEAFKSDINFKITSRELKNRVPSFKNFDQILEDKEKIPVGLSFLTGRPVCFESKKRVQHVMISGGSGQGKSSLAITLRRHDLRWGRPIFDIDPKGSAQDIKAIRTYCAYYGRLQDFKHFNVTDPENSHCYNPLAVGSVDERIEKMTSVLDLENEFYRGIAANVFTILFQCFDALNIVPTLRELCKLLIDKTAQHEFFNRVLALPADQYPELRGQISSFKDFDKDQIAGIQAKISRLNSPLFSKILNPSENKDKNLDLVEIVKKKQYAYFQLNIAQYKEVSTYLINLILYDLKLICGAIDGERLALDSDFLPVYIDEFGSFGNEDFPEFLRVARSGRLGITVMFQSFAGLDMITPVQKHEIATNTIYSVHFYSGSVSDIDFLTLMPGTIYTNQRSYQVLDNGMTPTENSKGTQSRSEELKVDPNLYRNLKSGQAGVYLKDKNEFEIVEIWHGKAAISDLKGDKFVPKSEAQTAKIALNKPVIRKELPLLLQQRNKRRKEFIKNNP
jgi:hypothetical protein